MGYGTMFIRCVLPILRKSFSLHFLGQSQVYMKLGKLVTLFSTSMKMEGTFPLEYLLKIISQRGVIFEKAVIIINNSVNSWKGSHRKEVQYIKIA